MTKQQTTELNRLLANPALKPRQRAFLKAHADQQAKAGFDWQRILEFIMRLIELFSKD